MAHWSHWREQHSVYVIVAQHRGDLRTSTRNQPTGRRDRSHRAEMAGHYRGDPAIPFELVQTIERQGEILVRLDPACIKGVASVPNLQRLNVSALGNSAITTCRRRESWNRTAADPAGNIRQR
jgi:hypothetical protein